MANDVEGEPKQVATVLTLIGGPTYGLLVNLLAPEEPAKQKLADIFATLDGHFAPKPLVIAERYRFNREIRDLGNRSMTTWRSYVVWLVTANSGQTSMSTSGIDSSAD